MDLAFYKRLIRLVERSEISEFSVEEGDTKIRIVKNSPGVTPQYSHPFLHHSEVHQAGSASKEVNITQDKIVSSESVNPNHYEIKSPIVGTFYRAPSPEADPFIKVGDKISQGAVLCIVEAMKLMNEIESDVSGKIVKILVDDATPVEYNQPLFLVEKD
ncbi:MAG: acetyl-CoA carboxylase biotin carboxyl carrier protein [Bacteroidetes bacterium]|nr:acetyl-CoA carboxylase biotin carboxyl carrier protein [Bacteroidota bacterium]